MPKSLTHILSCLLVPALQANPGLVLPINTATALQSAGSSTASTSVFSMQGLSPASIQATHALSSSGEIILRAEGDVLRQNLKDASGNGKFNPNEWKDPHEIIAAFPSLPLSGSAASNFLKAREALPGGRFTSINEIESLVHARQIKGIGSAKWSQMKGQLQIPDAAELLVREPMRRTAIRRRFVKAYTRFFRLWDKPQTNKKRYKILKELMDGQKVKLMHVPEGEDYSTRFKTGDPMFYYGSPDYLWCVGVLIYGPVRYSNENEITYWHFKRTSSEERFLENLEGFIHDLERSQTRIVIFQVMGDYMDLDPLKLQTKLGVKAVLLVPYLDKTKLDILAGPDAIAWILKKTRSRFKEKLKQLTKHRYFRILEWNEIKTSKTFPAQRAFISKRRGRASA